MSMFGGVWDESGTVYHPPVKPADDIIMVVYCDGPPDNAGQATHERREIKRYVRKADGRYEFFWSLIAGADADPRLKPSHWPKVLFHCRLCGFDAKFSRRSVEQRCADGSYVFTNRLSSILEPLHVGGVHEVNVRFLMKWL
jgi:hypothetical protein